MFGKQNKLAKPTAICFCAAVLSLFVALAWASPMGSTAPQSLGVILEPDHTLQTSAGQTVVYNHTLTNTGTETDTFLLEVTSSQGWLTELGSENNPDGTALLPMRVGAQMTASLWVSVTVPPGVACVREVTIITATSLLSSTVQDTAIDTTIVSCRIYLPLVLRRWPPIPYQPTLYVINNPDSDGNYTVSWAEQPVHLADTYTLEEATNAAFTIGLRIVCTTAQQACVVSDRVAGTYYYRVRGYNQWGFSEWSNTQSSVVLPKSQFELVNHGGTTYHLSTHGMLIGGSWRFYADGIAEVKNIGNCTSISPTITMSIYDAGSNLLASKISEPEVWHISAGQNSPVMFSDVYIGSYNVTNPPENLYAIVNITSHGSCTSLDTQRNLSVVLTRVVRGSILHYLYGNATNHTATTRNVEIIAWYRDDASYPGLITWCESQWKTIPPNSTSNFSFDGYWKSLELENFGALAQGQ